MSNRTNISPSRPPKPARLGPRGHAGSRVGLVRFAIAFAFGVWACGVLWFFSQSKESVASSGAKLAALAERASDLAVTRRLGGSSSPPSSSNENVDDASSADGSAAGRHSECPAMVYWRPKGEADAAFKVPYDTTPHLSSLSSPRPRRYATYEPDYGGFNNIRMTLETLVVFARVTGRTIVLPPKAPIYLLKDKPLDATFLLGHALPRDASGTEAHEAAARELLSSSKDKPGKNTPDKDRDPKKLRSVVDFFSEGVAALKAAGIVDVISFDEFVNLESGEGGLVYQASLRSPEQADPASASAAADPPAFAAAASAAATKAKLLGWNRQAEHGEDGDGARKKVRQWIREAVCAPRLTDWAAWAVDGATGALLARGSPNASAASAAARCPHWEPLKEAVVFGMPGTPEGHLKGHIEGHLEEGESQLGEEQGEAYDSDAVRRLAAGGNPRVNPAHAFARADFLTPRRRAHIVDQGQASEPWVHFQTAIQVPPIRPLFTHWYTMFLFDDYATDLHTKRLVRDYVRYDERVFCAAGKIIAKLDAEAKARGTTWSSIHVRHGELQYTNVQISPSELLAATSDWLTTEGEVLYVATDEEDLTWFSPLGRKFACRFLRDYAAEVAHLDNDLLGMVEQVVLSHGRTFTGTWFSTFSAYVCRLRGYYSGEHGRFPPESCFVYAPDNKRLDFGAWKMPQHAFYPREWELAWEGIDYEPPRDPHVFQASASFSTSGGGGSGAAGGGSHHEASGGASASSGEAAGNGRRLFLPSARRYYEDFKPERMVYPGKDVAAKKKAQRMEAQKQQEAMLADPNLF